MTNLITSIKEFVQGEIQVLFKTADVYYPTMVLSGKQRILKFFDQSTASDPGSGRMTHNCSVYNLMFEVAN